jgi:drug/metabolite transporter (DMT)-like permease
MSRTLDSLRNPGVLAALSSALLFGIATPVSKVLLAHADPWLLAGLLYAGSGIGLTILRVIQQRARVRPSPADLRYLLAAVLFGGIAAPVLLMNGLVSLEASGASLLLNAEGVFTALLAWIVFRENVDRRVLPGMLAIVAAAIVLSWKPTSLGAGLVPSLLVLGACLAWAIDNNVTRKVSLLDATWLASVKGLVAGATNLALACWLHAKWPSVSTIGVAMGLGAFAYGISLVLFVTALRYLGTARTGAYFSTAPFIGAVLAVIWLGEPVTAQLGIAFALMALGVWLHLTERHEHAHVHARMTHDHEHVHDEHHQHGHAEPVGPGVSHRHPHEHAPLSHSHPHYPDAHHRHDH